METPKLTKTQTISAISTALRHAIGSSPRFLAVVALEEVFSRLVPFINAWLLAKLISTLPHVLHNASAQAAAIRYVVLLTLFSIVPAVISSFSGVYRSKQRIELDLKIERRLQTAFANLPFAVYEDKHVLDAYDRASRFANRLGGFVLDRLTTIFGSVVTFVVATIAFWHFSPLMAVAIFFLSLPTLWLELKLQRMREKLWRDNTLNYRLAYAHHDLLQPRSIKETRLLGLVQFAIDKGQHYSRTAEMASVKADQSTEKYRIASVILNAAIEGWVLIRAVQRIVSGTLPVGQFIFVQQITAQYLGSLSGLCSQVQDLDEILFGVHDYAFIVGHETEAAGEDVHDIQQPLEFNHVSFTYPNADRASLCDLSLVIPAGKTVAIVGENGAGKTTLIKLLMKLYQPTEGSIMLGEQSLEHIDNKAWHKQLGVLFQDFQTFYDFTLRDNVRFGDISQTGDSKQIEAALAAADAKVLVCDLPRQLDTYLGKYIDEHNGTDLSGGQQQRLAIARTLFRKPSVLILDEPTSAIDAKAEHKIFSEIEKARHGRTTILISHRFSTIRKADYIYVLEKGRLKEEGKHEELMERRGIYHELFSKQAEGYR